MNDFVVTMMLLGAVSTGGKMPFWATANQYGLMPEYSGGLIQAGAHTRFDDSKDWKWCWGVSLAAREEMHDGFTFIPDEAYLSGGWRNLSLDLGIKHEEQYFMGASEYLGSLSATAGRMAWSGNTRSMPGYTLRLAPANIPYTKGHVQVYGSWGDYVCIDPYSYVQHHLVHSSRFGIIGHIGRFSLTLGLDHWAQWSGVHPELGQMPTSFVDYLRVVTGHSGGSASSESDRINVIGNQLGSELVKLDYRGDGWRITFQHEVPYDDRSGMKWQNFPDGVNTFCFSFDDKKRWVSDILLEAQYTMWQSGRDHQRLATDEEISAGTDPRLYTDPWGRTWIILGGGDNYWNNGEYKSGWTAWGRTKGNALFYPMGTRAGTLDHKKTVLGVENNRLLSAHVGLGGSIAHYAPYRLMFTWARCYGTYGTPYAKNPGGHEIPMHQLSLSLTAQVPFLKGSLLLLPGIYYDWGEILPSNFAATLGLRYVFKRAAR